MADRKIQVFGVHAPPPRPTIWAAGLLATGISLGFLAVLALWRVLD